MIRHLLICAFIVLTALAVPSPKCLPGTVPPPGGANQTVCYLFVNQSKSFNDAESYCRQQNGHLAAIKDAFTDTYLAYQAYGAFGQSFTSYWIGGKTVDYTHFTAWTWTKCDSIVKYSNFQDDQDSETSPLLGVCTAVLFTHDFWVPQNCTTSLPFICEVPGSVGSCDFGYTMLEETGMCYKLFSDKVSTHTFDQAEANCSADGGHLASIHSQSENYFVSSLAPGQQLGNYSMALWIGGKSDSNGVWTWTDGSPFDYQNWYSQSPGYCTGLLSDGDSNGNYRTQWEGGFTCTDPFGRFICKKPPSYISYYTN